MTPADKYRHGVADTLERLRHNLLQIANTAGDYRTGIAALTIHRRDGITAPIPCIYDLGLAITIAGRKHVSMGGEVFTCGDGEFLLASVDLPLVSNVTRASPAEPFLGMMLRLSSRLILQVAAGMNVRPLPRSAPYNPLSHGVLTGQLLSALERLIALLEEPELVDVVGPLILQETIARLLAGENGARFLQLNATGSPGQQIAQIMVWMKQNFSKPIRVDELAARAHMSPSSFRQHFKAVAGMSPLQYAKHLRLQEARQLMLGEDLDASTVGLRVGYESLSQFSREYARMFGEPPRRDIKRLRQQSRQ